MFFALMCEFILHESSIIHYANVRSRCASKQSHSLVAS